MTLENWMQLVVVTVIAGAFVSKTTHAVLSRVDIQIPVSTPLDWASFGSPRGPDNRCAAHGLASLIGLDPSRIDVTFTAEHEVHCSILACPDELIELTRAAEAAIDHAFRERHHWTDWRVVLRLEAAPKTNG